MRDTRPDYHDFVLKQIRYSIDPSAAINTDSQRMNLIKKRKVQQTLFHCRIHMFDNGGFVLRPRFVRYSDPSEYPLSIATNI